MAKSAVIKRAKSLGAGWADPKVGGFTKGQKGGYNRKTSADSLRSVRNVAKQPAKGLNAQAAKASLSGYQSARNRQRRDAKGRFA
jgi:hypothetical protein